jgi:formylglycine-generating enzyme required for sulfatase activity
VAGQQDEAEAAKGALAERMAQFDSLTAGTEDPALATLRAQLAEIDALYDQRAYGAALTGYGALLPQAEALYATLSTPPGPACEGEGLPLGMRVVEANSYPLETLMDRPNFRADFGADLMERVPGGTVTIPAPFCIQSRPVSHADFADFLAQMTPAEQEALPEEARTGDPADPVLGLPRLVVEQYAQFLSEQTGRVVRLPTLAELFAADGFVTGATDALIWTADTCSANMSLVARLPENANRAAATCRLSSSISNTDIAVRLVVEGAGAQ